MSATEPAKSAGTIPDGNSAISGVPSHAKKSKSRSYSDRTLKIVFALSSNQCAHPDCNEPIIANGTPKSPDHVVGHISHIYAYSEKGPRGKPGLTDKERDGPDNLMLFCPTHHSIVDGQHETYQAELLIEWKKRHERRARDRLAAKLTDIGYAELEVAAKALMSPSAAASGDYSNIPPAEKIAKNQLGSTSEMLLTLGAAKSRECERVLRDAAQLDPGFPDQLRNGFVAKYDSFRNIGLEGDDLFLALYEWAGGGGSDKAREVAGLCVLTHLFVICDVFEK